MENLRRQRLPAFVFAHGILAFLLGPAAAEEAHTDYWPGFVADPSVPTFQSVLGHGPGEAIVTQAEMLRYFEALERASGGRMKIFEYARSWQGKALVYAAIGSRETIARLDAIREDIGKLADPRRLKAGEAEKLLGRIPATCWLGYSVHGNEISGTNAALLTAYHLLAAKGDDVVQEILEKTLVFIDPLQNPDGRDRFVAGFRENLGLIPDPSPYAAEHDERWPSGRVNHYLFDLNRDWFASTQPETRGRIAAFNQWYPLVFVDLHEMGGNSSYYFSPEAVPFNPHLTDTQVERLETFGRNNAKWFDLYGFDYFTREIFDAFYPGYGASWPSYHGGIAMTYEQASAGGLVYRRTDGTDLSFGEAVRHHFVASISTAEATAQNARALLEEFHQYRQSAIEEGRSGEIRAYVLPRRGDLSALRKLVGILVEQGVEVQRAQAPLAVGDAELPSGSYVVSLAQPAKRLARVLLDDDVPMASDFVAEQERRRKKKLPDEIYDVTAWSLPLMFNVECIASPKAIEGEFEPADAARIEPGTVHGRRAKVAYLVPWGTAAAGRLLAAALRKELRVLSADRAFAQGDRRYPAGSLIFKVEDHGKDLESTLRELARTTGADVVATDTSWIDDGVNFGSEHVHHVRAPRVALAWDRPTMPYSAGATRFVLERQFGYPVTPLRARLLATMNLDSFDVLILPDLRSGEYELGEEGAKRLASWVRAGGTLIALGRSVAQVAGPRLELLQIDQEDVVRPEGEETPGSEGKPAGPEEGENSGRVAGRILESEDDFRKAIRAERELPDPVAGVLVRARVDPDHWLGAGVARTINVLVQGSAIFTPITTDKGTNAAYFAGPDELLASGHLWEENRRQLAFKPFVVVQEHGRGIAIGFTADPTFRAYMDGLDVLFLNAVFRGPAHARPLVGE